jgi:hypothetical protein
LFRVCSQRDRKFFRRQFPRSDSADEPEKTPQDMADLMFLIRRDHLTPVQIEGAFAHAVIPDLVELRDAFERAKPQVRALARQD